MFFYPDSLKTFSRYDRMTDSKNVRKLDEMPISLTSFLIRLKK